MIKISCSLITVTKTTEQMYIVGCLDKKKKAIFWFFLAISPINPKMPQIEPANIYTASFVSERKNKISGKETNNNIADTQNGFGTFR